VKRYLETLGVPTGRLDTVSFGEADPAVPGHDESAWRWNRRVQFHVTR
jgi:peptidoglycan-associated lipoprotein